MKFTEEQINSFIALYKKIFNEEIDRAEALYQANALVNLVKLTYKPMTRAEWKKYTKHLEKDFNCDII